MDKTPPQRGHALLNDNSPLTRAITKAAGLPDVEALMVALAHPMTEQDQEALAQRAGGHPAHKTRLQHLRKLALEKHGDVASGDGEMDKSLAKSKGATSHHRLISLGQEGPGSRGGHPWWNEHRNHGQGDWDYGPRPKGHRSIHEPLHPLYEEHQARLKGIEEAAYQLGCEVNLPLYTWDKPKRTKKEKEHIAHQKPVEEVHLQRLRDAWTTATAEHHVMGRDWYPLVYEMCQEWSDHTHNPTPEYPYSGRPLSPDEIAMMIAVASPRMPWESNLNIVHYAIFGKVLAERGSDGKKLQKTHVKQVMEKLKLIQAGAYPTITAMLKTVNDQPQDLTYEQLMEKTPKTYSFWRNMTNRDNDTAATADRHMFAIIGFNVDDRGDEVYHYCLRAMQQIAAEKGVEPRALQAVTWLWYEDHIAGHVKETMRQVIKDRVADNDVYGAYLREARGHQPTDKDPDTLERVALQRRKMEEESAKLAAAEARAAASQGSPAHAAHLRAVRAARTAVESRQDVIDRHNFMIETALRHAGTTKSFRDFRRGSCQKSL